MYKVGLSVQVGQMLGANLEEGALKMQDEFVGSNFQDTFDSDPVCFKLVRGPKKS